MTLHTDPSRRHDFVLLFDAVDSNPNGDPDAGNLPRVDVETGQGIVTDVSIKRKIRNFVAVHTALLDEDDPARTRRRIYVEEGVALNSRHREAGDAVGYTPKKNSKKKPVVPDARRWMCDTFWDVRMFGAVMSTGDINCGQVRGPVQIGFGRSIDPVVAHDITITRVAVTKEDDLKKLEDGAGGKDREMARKALIPYGLYKVTGTYSPHLAARTGRLAEGTGADRDDLELLWTALSQMWDLDVSAARTGMATRALHVFTHDSMLGNAPRHVLFDAVLVTRADGVEVPRKFSDYEVRVAQVPTGVTHTALV